MGWLTANRPLVTRCATYGNAMDRARAYRRVMNWVAADHRIVDRPPTQSWNMRRTDAADRVMSLATLSRVPLADS